MLLAVLKPGATEKRSLRAEHVWGIMMMRDKRWGNWRGMAWVVLACLLLFAGCDNKKEEKVKGTAAPAETPMESPEDGSANLGAWTRAMGSVLIELNEGNAYVFGGYEKNRDNKAGATKILKSSWGIKSKKDLLKKIRELLRTGDRTAFREEAKDMNSMSKEKLKVAMKQLSGDMLVHYQMVQHNWKAWKKKGLLAWDMCRISHLAQWGYIADYLTLEEAQAVMEPAIRKCRENFASWDEVQNNWLDGYCLFATIDRKVANTDYTVRKNLYQELKKEQKEGQPLYDDQLFQQEVKPLPGYSFQKVMKEGLPAKKPAATPKAGTKTKMTTSPDKTTKHKTKAKTSPEETTEPKTKAKTSPDKTTEPKTKAKASSEEL